MLRDNFTVEALNIHREPKRVYELQSLFAQIAVEEAWKPGNQIMAQVGRSVYFDVEAGGELAGGIQLEIDDGSNTWSFQSVWPEARPACRGRAAYIAILALKKSYRGDYMLMWKPCISMWQYCKRVGIEELWIVATPRTLAAYRRLGWPLMVRGELRSHWGEDCYLTSMTVDGVAASLEAKARRSLKYRKIVASMHRKPPCTTSPLALPAAV